MNCVKRSRNSKSLKNLVKINFLGRWGEQILYRQSLRGAPSRPDATRREARAGVEFWGLIHRSRYSDG